MDESQIYRDWPNAPHGSYLLLSNTWNQDSARKVDCVSRDGNWVIAHYLDGEMIAYKGGLVRWFDGSVGMDVPTPYAYCWEPPPGTEITTTT